MTPAQSRRGRAGRPTATTSFSAALGIVSLLTSATLVAACSGAAPSLPPVDGATTAEHGVPSSANLTHVSLGSTIGDVVHHPALDDFGRFVLPLDAAPWDEEMPLKQVDSLLPYHSNVSPQAVVDTVNAVIDEASGDGAFFSRPYTAEQIERDPSKESVGLFFFPGDPGAPFAIIAPGGGFSYVGSVHEGFPYALELRSKGFNAFVLQYRVGSESVACEDLSAALSHVLDNAHALGVAAEGYSLWGSSAGARMAARVGSATSRSSGATSLPRPAVVVMAYTGHSDYSGDDPPTFAVVGEDDTIAAPSAMRRRVDNLLAAGVDAKIHVYPDTGHGFGLGAGTPAEGWVDSAAEFWSAHLAQPPPESS